MADIGDIHDTVDVVAFIAECLFQDILHNITAQVSDVRKMINGRSAGVHFYTARCVCQEFSFFMGCRIIKIHKRSLLFSFRADTDAEVMIHKKAKKQKSKKASAVSDKDIRDAACGACFPCTALVPY